MQDLQEFLRQEVEEGRVFYPPASHTFRALQLTPLDQLRCVILGQDPYHGPGQAMGLSFSVPPGVRVPPSLRNIYQELHNDLGLPLPAHGDLTRWAEAGVLMLNAVLSVRPGQAASHAGRGWEQFTDQVLKVASAHAPPFCAFLWGAHAQKKEALIDASRHLVIKAPHPSPLSAHRGFFHSHQFSRCNQWLESIHGRGVDWTP